MEELDELDETALDELELDELELDETELDELELDEPTTRPVVGTDSPLLPLPLHPNINSDIDTITLEAITLFCCITTPRSIGTLISTAPPLKPDWPN